ncbi:hypothetical protein ACQJBY_061135 [Aegilops geniculata]
MSFPALLMTSCSPTEGTDLRLWDPAGERSRAASPCRTRVEGSTDELLVGVHPVHPACADDGRPAPSTARASSILSISGHLPGRAPPTSGGGARAEPGHHAPVANSNLQVARAFGVMGMLSTD